MPFHTKSGGVWRDCTPHVRVSGVWRKCKAAYVRSGGVWRQVFQDLLVDLADASYSATGVDLTTPYSASAGFRINSDGTLERYVNGSYFAVEAWLESGSAADVECRIVKSSGTDTASGMTNAVWYNCGTTREFTISRNSIGDSNWVGTLEFRPAGGGSNLDSATMTLTASCDNPV